MTTLELFHTLSQLNRIGRQKSINYQHSFTSQVSNLKDVRIVIEFLLYLLNQIGGDTSNAIGEQ